MPHNTIWKCILNFCHGEIASCNGDFSNQLRTCRSSGTPHTGNGQSACARAAGHQIQRNNLVIWNYFLESSIHQAPASMHRHIYHIVNIRRGSTTVPMKSYVSNEIWLHRKYFDVIKLLFSNIQTVDEADATGVAAAPAAAAAPCCCCPCLLPLPLLQQQQKAWWIY